MNHITNDRGETVIAVGAPASVARVQVERPRLIERLNSIFFQECDSPARALDEAIEAIRAEGIKSPLETSSLLKASHFGKVAES